MKKTAITSVSIVVLLFIFSACSVPDDLYGTWYNDTDGQRNALQLSENKKGDDVFAWAIYDLEKEETVSISEGYFSVDNGTLVLDFVTSDYNMTLNYELDGDKLKLSTMDSTIVLTRFVLDE